MRWSPHPATTVRSIGLLAVGLLAGACAIVESVQPDMSAPTPTSSTFIPVTSGEDSEPDLTSVTEAAVADLSGRLDIDPASIEVVQAEHVNWPDGRLGCPEPVGPYTLDQVEGFRVVLGFDDNTYHYHAGNDAVPALCGAFTKRDGGPGAPEPSIPPPIR